MYIIRKLNKVFILARYLSFYCTPMAILIKAIHSCRPLFNHASGQRPATPHSPNSSNSVVRRGRSYAIDLLPCRCFKSRQTKKKALWASVEHRHRRVRAEKTKPNREGSRSGQAGVWVVGGERRRPRAAISAARDWGSLLGEQKLHLQMNSRDKSHNFSKPPTPPASSSSLFWCTGDEAARLRRYNTHRLKVCTLDVSSHLFLQFALKCLFLPQRKRLLDKKGLRDLLLWSNLSNLFGYEILKDLLFMVFALIHL